MALDSRDYKAKVSSKTKIIGVAWPIFVRLITERESVFEKNTELRLND